MLAHFNYATECGISKLVSLWSSGQYCKVVFLVCGENTGTTVILLPSQQSYHGASSCYMFVMSNAISVHVAFNKQQRYDVEHRKLFRP